MPGVPPIGPAASYSSDDELIAAVVANVKWQMAQDRKTTALKQLQVSNKTDMPICDDCPDECNKIPVPQLLTKTNSTFFPSLLFRATSGLPATSRAPS